MSKKYSLPMCIFILGAVILLSCNQETATIPATTAATTSIQPSSNAQPLLTPNTAISSTPREPGIYVVTSVPTVAAATTATTTPAPTQIPKPDQVIWYGEAGRTYLFKDGMRQEFDYIRPQWSPNGEWLLPLHFDSDTREVYRRTANGYEFSSSFETRHDLLVWSPNSQYIAYTEGERGTIQLYLHDVVNKEERLIVEDTREGRPRLVWQVSWSPDGEKLAFTVGNVEPSDIAVVDIDGSHLEYLSIGSSDSPMWISNHEIIFYKKRPPVIGELPRYDLMRKDISTKEESIIAPYSGYSFVNITWLLTSPQSVVSPDLQYIFVAAKHRKFFVGEQATPTPHYLAHTPAIPTESYAEGIAVGLLKVNEPGRFQWLSPFQGRHLYYESPTWSQDGHFLMATKRDNLRVSSFENGTLGKFTTILTTTVYAFGWVPDNVSRTITWSPSTNTPEAKPSGTAEPCENIQSRLKIGEQARVKEDNDTPSSLREEAGVSGKLIGYLVPGTTMLVKDGPICKDDYLWWYVLADTNQAGWVAEGGTEIWLEPIPTPTQ